MVDNVGFSLKNGTKTGIIQQIYEKQVDSSLSIYSVSGERIKEFDFITITTAEYVKVEPINTWKILT